jgi:hypothetical protein
MARSGRAVTADRGLVLDIAGVAVAIVGGSTSARTWARDRYGVFVVERPPDFVLEVRETRWPRGAPRRPRAALEGNRFRIDLAACRIEGDRAAGRGVLMTPPAVTAVSPSALRALVSLLLLPAGGVLLHAAAVLEGRAAWVFVGPSGSGKTTLARLAGGRAVLNDETVGLVRGERGWEAAATPFFGEGGTDMAPANLRAPVAAIFSLRQADSFSHRRLTKRESVAITWAQALVLRRERRLMAEALAILAQIAGAVPCYELGFAPTPEVWDHVRRLA